MHANRSPPVPYPINSIRFSLLHLGILSTKAPFRLHVVGYIFLGCIWIIGWDVRLLQHALFRS